MISVQIKGPQSIRILTEIFSNSTKIQIYNNNCSLTLFSLGFLETLHDWGGGENCPCSLLAYTQQLLALELSFKFVWKGNFILF